MIKLYQYNGKQIRETEAERETANFWIINGRRESKALEEYPDQACQAWYRTPEEAVRAVINHKAIKRDKHLAWAQQNQDGIDEASGFLFGLNQKEAAHDYIGGESIGVEESDLEVFYPEEP